MSLRRSPRFWFDDGNVVLQSQNVQFRVHRSLLSLHSDIMEDCFRSPQPEDAETLEGCPVVHLHDPVQDIDNMCALLYGVYHIHPDEVDPSYLLTMIRMGRKYEISYFKDTALYYLIQLFPWTLEKWDASGVKAAVTADKSQEFLFDVINLAYDNDYISILPAAFLSLFTRHHLVEIISGVKRTDHSLALLNPLAMKAAMLGRADLMASFLRNIPSRTEDGDHRFTHAVPCHECCSKPYCAEGLTHLLARLSDLAVDGNRVHIPRHIEQVFYQSYDADPFCEFCFNVLKESFKNSRELWWEELPAKFNLPSWDKIMGDVLLYKPF